MPDLNNHQPQLNNNEKLNMVIVGQGAIGLLYYYFFSQNPKQIKLSLLSSKNASTDINALSYQKAKALIKSTANVDDSGTINHSANTVPLLQASDAELADADIILLCVKSYQAKHALTEIAEKIANKALIIFCHNGVGAFDELPEDIKTRFQFLTLLTTHGCKKHNNQNNSYVIEHTGEGRTELGEIKIAKVNNAEVENAHQDNEPTIKTKQLINVFNMSINDFYWREDITTPQWTKLAINCVINPLTATDNVCNGEILAEHYQAQAIKIINEIVQVAEFEHVSLSASKLIETVKEVAHKTALNSSSMRCDILEKRPTEINYINGYIARLGKKHQVSTPENSRLVQAITELELLAKQTD